MPSLLALTHGQTDPASRFRILQYLPALAARGWRVAHRPNVPPRDHEAVEPAGLERASGVAATLLRRINRGLDVRRARRFDVVWANRDLLEGDPRWERRLLSRNPRFVFDVDDALYLSDTRGHFAEVCARAACVVAGNETLAAEASRHTSRVVVIPTVVDTSTYRTREAAPAGDVLRVGWCGSDLSIRETLFPFLPLLARLQAKRPFRFTIVSRPRPVLPSCGLTWEFVEWSPVAETNLGTWMDVGIMPLGPEPFFAAKCGCKILQYLACSLPAIATPAGVNARILSRGGGGFAASTEEDWERALEACRDPRTRSRLGEAGRRHVEAEFSLARWLPVVDALLRRTAAGAGAGASGQEQPAA